ncbi:MAG: M28 family peptidase [Myxococcota bacterium]
MLLAWVPLVAVAKKPVPPPPPLEQVAATLVGRALLSDEPYTELGTLCDDIGHRLSGSPELNAAIAWGAARMTEDGLVNVRQEPVMVPVWVRGETSAALTAPVARPLRVLALGGTVGTPPGGVEAEVIVVGSFDELEARKAEVAGKIVLFDVPFTDYGETVAYRGGGPNAAARLGAVAALVRSVSPTSLDTPHTGMTRTADDVTPIPSAAVTIEAATQIRRMIDRGQPVKVRLTLGAHQLPDAPSANVVGEVRGRERPQEVVVLACHLDSWDVGQGAQDDGAGCAIAMGAADLIRGLPVAPRRTVRVVLYTNEENGLAGGVAYAEAHPLTPSELHVAAIEADTGAGRPLGFRMSLDEDETPALVEPLIDALAPVADLLAPIGASALTVGHGGSDIGPLGSHGVPTLGLSQDTTGYWPIHHTEADTFDKIDPTVLAQNVAAMAVMAYALAELPLPVGPAAGGTVSGAGGAPVR